MMLKNSKIHLPWGLFLVLLPFLATLATPAYSQAKKTSPPAAKSKTSKPATPDGGARKKKVEPSSESSEDGEAAQNARMGTAAEPEKKVAKEKPRKYFGISADLGYEATYGNGATLHLYPASLIDINAGVGYNTTGLKAGVGPALLLWFGQSVGMIVGASYVYSQGTSGQISLDANFTPEGSSAAEKIKATKKYKVSPAQIVGAYTGITFRATDAIRIDLKGCYNKVIAGNVVTFDDKIQYDKTIAPTNEDGFNKQFDSQASELVQAGGIGFSIGLQFLL